MACGTHCVPGLTNEEVETKSKTELSKYIEDSFIRQGGKTWWVGGILNYIAAIFAQGIADGLTDVTRVSAYQTRYNPNNHSYQCEADLIFDTQKLISFEKFYNLKLLMAPEGGARFTNSFIRGALAKNPTNPEPIEFYLNTTVTMLMASGFQRAMSKVRYIGQYDANGELVLKLDPNFSTKRMLEQTRGPSR